MALLKTPEQITGGAGPRNEEPVDRFGIATGNAPSAQTTLALGTGSRVAITLPGGIPGPHRSWSYPARFLAMPLIQRTRARSPRPFQSHSTDDVRGKDLPWSSRIHLNGNMPGPEVDNALCPERLLIDPGVLFKSGMKRHIFT